MMEKILDIVRERQRQRESEHLVPAHVSFLDIKNGVDEDPQDTINDLCREGVLEWHRTLNSIAFLIRE